MTYLDALADKIRDNVAAEVGVPDNSEHLFLLYALLARAKGTQVSAMDVHDAWVLWMQARGEQHESMVPFDDLSADTQAEDLPFLEAIRAAVESSGPHDV